MRRTSIIQGEHVVVDEPDVVVSTVLGSCISVCLFDNEARVGGMNHFLLGEPSVSQALLPQDLQRYGLHAMEILINGMMKRGASRNRLRAHLYGGANIVAGLGRIGSQNADFARRFLETEGIILGHVDVGGKHARRVEFLPFEGKSRCKTVAHAPTSETVLKALPPTAELELF